jgi:acetolactate synthase I/II/III large subunit
MSPTPADACTDSSDSARDTIPPESTIVSRRATSALQADQPTERIESSPSSLPASSVARRLVEVLLARGIDTYFGVPGGPICPLFEAVRLESKVRLVESRHESHAAFSAAAYHRATGKTPVLLVTAGPGITHCVSGVASACLERAAVLVVAGDVAWATHGGRLAQDSGPEGLAAEQILASITRAQVRVTNGRSAVSQALSALERAEDPTRPGPALLVVPIDRATEEAPSFDVADAAAVRRRTPDKSAVRRVADAFEGAKRPLLVLGNATRRDPAAVRDLVDRLDVPFITTPAAKGVVDERHPRSLRNGGMAASKWARRYTAEPVDVALVLGTDLDDTSIGPTPYIGQGGSLFHVDIEPRVFHRNLPTKLGITSDLVEFCQHLGAAIGDGRVRQAEAILALENARSAPAFDVPDFETDDSSGLQPHRAVGDLQAAFGPTARFVSDIGEHMLFALHYLTASGPDAFHIQLNLGSMGSGIAASVGLGLADPRRTVVCICGDGGMHMSGMEILTAKKLELPVVYAVFNDSRYNMVHHGMRQIFGSASDYATPDVDFAAWAQAMGIPAAVIRSGGELTPALAQGLMAGGGPVVLDLRIDREVRVQGGGRVEALRHMSMLSAGSAREAR